MLSHCVDSLLLLFDFSPRTAKVVILWPFILGLGFIFSKKKQKLLSFFFWAVSVSRTYSVSLKIMCFVFPAHNFAVFTISRQVTLIAASRSPHCRSSGWASRADGAKRKCRLCQTAQPRTGSCIGVCF